jgi:predicted esterase
MAPLIIDEESLNCMMIKNIKKFKWGFIAVLLLAGLILLQAQTFYGKRRTGFYATREDGAPFGYYVPRGIDEAQEVPLIVIFANKATAVMKWKAVADQEEVIIVAVQPKLGGVWNFEWDVDRAIKKVNELLGWYPIDKNKVWAAGYEKGGMFALLMTVNHPELFKAAAASDSKTADVKLLRGDAAQGEYIAVFDYRKDASLHQPLWMMNFTESEYVSQEEIQKTKELFEQFGYAVTYETVVGESHSPSQKVIQQMYRWLQSQTA